MWPQRRRLAVGCVIRAARTRGIHARAGIRLAQLEEAQSGWPVQPERAGVQSGGEQYDLPTAGGARSGNAMVFSRRFTVQRGRRSSRQGVRAVGQWLGEAVSDKAVERALPLDRIGPHVVKLRLGHGARGAAQHGQYAAAALAVRPLVPLPRPPLGRSRAAGEPPRTRT